MGLVSRVCSPGMEGFLSLTVAGVVVRVVVGNCARVTFAIAAGNADEASEVAEVPLE